MQLEMIKLALIHPPKFLLRPVMKITIGYQEMLDSIHARGLLQPLLVRPLYNKEYELVDGNYRYNCCKQLRHEEVPCIVRDLTDDEVVIDQLVANGIRPDTTPVEYAERLAFILKSNPEMTVPQLSRMINKSPHWIRKILRLTTCSREINQHVQRGEMPVESACALARLPNKLQSQYVELACKLPVREFVKMARNDLKQYREDSRNAYIDNHPVNQRKPVPILRKIPEIRSEFKSPVAAGPALLLSEAATPMDGWVTCLAWVLHMDPESLEMQQRQIEKRQQQEEIARKKRRQERQKLMEARKRAGDASLLIDGCSFTPITEFGEMKDE